MAESTTVSAAQPNIPQPGDGAYLASRIPQPGDGAYLAAQSQRNSGGPSRPRGQPGRSNGPRKRNGNGPRNGNGTVNGNNADVANGASDAAAQLATLSIEEVTPANRRSGSSARNGRRLPTAGLGDSFVPISESDGTDKKSNNRRAANNQRRRARAAQGAAENDEEARALGLGRVDLDVSPMPSGVSTPLNPGAAHFTPNGSAVPSPSASSGGEGNEATPPASESGYGKKGRNAREPQPRREQRAKKEAPPKPVSSRRAAFERGSKLTTADDKPAANAHHDRHDHDHQHNSNQPDDLNSRLTRGLRGKPFIECPICFAPIYAQQQTWSCLPPHSGPVFPAGMPENERVAFTSSHYTACYTPFHIQCIRDWSSRSLKDETERLRTIESADEPYWRCPGCQKRRTSKVSEYRAPPLAPTMPLSLPSVTSRVLVSVLAASTTAIAFVTLARVPLAKRSRRFAAIAATRRRPFLADGNNMPRSSARLLTSSGLDGLPASASAASRTNAVSTTARTSATPTAFRLSHARLRQVLSALAHAVRRRSRTSLVIPVSTVSLRSRPAARRVLKLALVATRALSSVTTARAPLVTSTSPVHAAAARAPFFSNATRCASAASVASPSSSVSACARHSATVVVTSVDASAAHSHTRPSVRDVVVLSTSTLAPTTFTSAALLAASSSAVASTPVLAPTTRAHAAAACKPRTRSSFATAATPWSIHPWRVERPSTVCSHARVPTRHVAIPRRRTTATSRPSAPHAPSSPPSHVHVARTRQSRTSAARSLRTV
ncbi:FKBP12-associated protein [Apiotrichum porosum]|uniref:FKBP12-associated protein n=1 Tax=Apiotrichum porosum TaxID=105984 RepID=A0A427YB96_9TREE|nr:FKBP12-associated protein [Apiotrichum porosum]RSH88400.1 FKBP12-associated protein [Apiotrichum porosum]